jgi:hypothetical protein
MKSVSIRTVIGFFMTLQCYLATSSQAAKIFYEEARTPGILSDGSWFPGPGFLMKLILVAAPPRCVFVFKDSAVQTTGQYYENGAETRFSIA